MKIVLGTNEKPLETLEQNPATSMTLSCEYEHISKLVVLSAMNIAAFGLGIEDFGILAMVVTKSSTREGEKHKPSLDFTRQS